MLTVKEINEVSFGKAGFSGYKPEDVDKFIDEVAAAFQQLSEERDEAVRRAAAMEAEHAALTQKNAELQEKVTILAQKVESYREDEEGIKEVLLSAQKMAKRTLSDAQAHADEIIQDARDQAAAINAEAKEEAVKTAREYMAAADEKRDELEEVKRQVSMFRQSLLEMYRKHLELIDHIPSFRIREKTSERAQREAAEKAEEEAAKVAEEAAQQQPSEEPEEEPASVQEEAPIQEEAPAQEKAVPVAVPAPAPQQQPKAEQPAAPAEKPAAQPEAPKRRSLHERMDFTRELAEADEEDDFHRESDLTEMGIKAISDIPESLQRERDSHFKDLEFGDDVDLGGDTSRKKRK